MASSARAGEPELLLTGESEDPESVSMQAAAPAPWRRRGPVAVAAIAVLVLAAVALLSSHRSRKAGFPGGVVADEVTMLVDAHGEASGPEVTEENDPCSSFPHLKLEKTIHNNLGGHGPDSGAEGIIYNAVAIDPDEGSEIPCHVKINVVEGAYTPWQGMQNGMHGFYGSIVLTSGTSAKLMVTVVKTGTDEPLKVKHASLTFFDLDHDKDEKSIESVTIGGMQEVTLSKHTEVVTEVNNDGTKTFSATKYGTGDDNPTNPLTLNQEQRNRAVTLDFLDVSEIPVTLKATAGEGPRVFIFVGRPSLKCAIGSHWEAKSAAAGQRAAWMLVTALASLALLRLSPA